ncbi:major facilitator superfamily domain-containing protein 3-like [Dermacentor variabilis]|uniref:major facilitator superfamily domain-containing protein 3-like n=1 Tax=Dermacentor variabilis TaxID=34621 RepID=UPI003F5B1B1A
MGTMLESVLTYAYLTVLYFVQGIPYGVQDKLLPQYLRSKRFSYSKVTLARVLLVPWLCKPLFASYIEKRWTQKRWLQVFLATMAAITWLSSYFGDNVWSFVSTLFFLNVVSASFDISVDIVAMDVLQASQLSVGSAVQVGSYKVGAIFGGGVLFLLQLLAGVKGILRGMSVAYALALCLVTLRNDSEKAGLRSEEEPMEESVGDEKFKPGDADAKSPEGLRRRKGDSEKMLSGSESTSRDASTDETIPGSLLERLKYAISVEGTLGLAVFLIFYKAGEYGILTTYPSFLLDRGYSYFVVGFLNGGLGQVISILGTIIGGYMARSSRSHKSFLLKLCIARILPAALICVTNTRLFGRPKNVYFGVTAMLGLNLISGMITTVAFTMMMSMSQTLQRGLRSTHFSFLCTVEVVGKLAASVLVGPCIDLVGKTPTYFVMTALIIASIATIRLLK